MYSTKDYKSDVLKIYGISQNPVTKDYIMIHQDGYCEKCSKKYTDIKNRWCKSCEINNLKICFTNWTSESEEIDNFIHEMQLKISEWDSIVFEWIPYNQFKDIKEISRDNHIHSATWKDGLLHYDKISKRYERDPDKEVILNIICKALLVNF